MERGGPHAEKAAFKAVSGNPPSSFVPPLQGSCLSREGDPWAWVASGHCDSWTPSYFNSFMKAAGSQGSTALSVPKTAHQPIPTLRALLSAAQGQGFERRQHLSSAVFLGPHFLGFLPASLLPQRVTSLPCSVCTLLCLFHIDQLGIAALQWDDYLAVRRRVCEDMILYSKSNIVVCVSKTDTSVSIHTTFIYTKT